MERDGMTQCLAWLDWSCPSPPLPSYVLCIAEEDPWCAPAVTPRPAALHHNKKKTTAPKCMPSLTHLNTPLNLLYNPHLSSRSRCRRRLRLVAWLDRAARHGTQVSRSQLLQHAEQVMSMYTPSKAVLEFRFAGEKGLGAGVTASFYSAVAAELQRRSVNTKV